MVYTTEIPGMPGGPVTTNHPIKIKLLDASNTYQRPGIGWPGQRLMVQHGTGNPTSMAAGEAYWLVDLKASGNQQSYHYITDDRETWVCLPIPEHGWHAADGNGPGNKLGIANEMVENADLWADTKRALQAVENAAEIMGITAARTGAAGPKQHWDFNGALPPALRHDCPNKLRYRYLNGRLAWDIYVERYKHHEAAERIRMGETPAPVPAPEYPVAQRIKEVAGRPEVVILANGAVMIRAGLIVEAIRDTPRKMYATTASDDIGPVIGKGQDFPVQYLIENADGSQWWYTEWGTRVKKADTKIVGIA